jgi:hypothetical protein
MDSEQRDNLAASLLEAGRSGKKTHVISLRGSWVIINESSSKAIAKYKLKQQATRKAKLLLDNGDTEVVIVHNSDGSVDKLLSIQSSQLQNAEID